MLVSASVSGAGQDRLTQSRATAYSWYALCLLLATYTMHAVDRSAPSVLLEPIKAAFSLTDAEMGALGPLTHGIAFALTTLPIGMLADRVNRVRLIAAIVSVWSGLTMLCGAASSVWLLVVARFGVGAAEGGFNPSALSLLTDFFPRNQRSTALGIFYLGTAFGTGGIFLVGSVVAANYGWRAAFLVAGLPGLLLAVLVLFTLREPLRGGFDPKLTEAKAAPSIREISNEIFRRPALIYAIIAATLSVMMVASFYHWTASYLIRQYGVSLEQAGMSMAVATGLMQAIASAIFGPITDRYAGGRPDRIGFVPAAVLLATIPVGLCVLYAPNAWFAIAGVLAFGFMMGAWLAQGFGTVLFLARPQMRGSVAGVVQLLANLVGNGLGPTIAGLVSNSLGGNAASLRWALLYVLLLNLPAAFFFMLSSRPAGGAEKGQKLS